MSNRSSSFIAILAIVLGMSGLGLGAYSVFFQSPIPGAPGEDGADGAGGIVIGILNPDQGDIVSDTIEIRGLVAGSNHYTVSVLINDSSIGTTLPLQWDTTSVADGWWNITVIATDVVSGNTTQDDIIIYVINNPEENHLYYCSSQSEISSALTDIGAGDGTIIITEDITLTSTITVNGGGSYVIQGISQSITVDCGANRVAFSITNANECFLRDLTIDAGDITSNTVNAIYITTNSIHVENIKILGDASRTGRGIYFTQSEVWISDCYISEMNVGIFVYQTATNSIHITDNTIIDCDATSSGIGININNFNSQVICEGNYIATCFCGIQNNGYYCTIANNIFYQNIRYGIQNYGNYNTLSGNSITGATISSSVDYYGIILDTNADYNVLTGNIMTSHISSGSGDGYGLNIDSGCDENTIVGNTMLLNDVNFTDSGTGTVKSGNNYV